MKNPQIPATLAGLAALGTLVALLYKAFAVRDACLAAEAAALAQEPHPGSST